MYRKQQLVFISVDGCIDTLIISIDEYEQMQPELILLEMIAEFEDDIKNGRVGLFSDSLSDIRKKLYKKYLLLS